MADRRRKLGVKRAKERTLRSLSTWLNSRRFAQTEPSTSTMEQDAKSSTQGSSAGDIVIKLELPWSVEEEPHVEEISSAHHACQRCSAAFMLSSSLKIHMESFHGETPHRQASGASASHDRDNNNTTDKLGAQEAFSDDRQRKSSAEASEGFMIKQEAEDLSLKAEPADEPPSPSSPAAASSAVHIPAQPLSDGCPGWLLSQGQVCQRCSATFVLPSSLQLHLALCHGVPTCGVSPRCPASNPCDVGHHSDGEKRVKNLSQAVGDDRGEDAQSDDGEDERDEEDGDKSNGRRSFACPFCGRCFQEQGQLQSHTVVHRGQRSFACQVCSQAFSTLHSLTAHKGSHSADRSQFVCDVCSKVCRRAEELERHKAVHVEEKLYACDMCKKKFNLPWHLKLHRMAHFAVKRTTRRSCAVSRPVTRNATRRTACEEDKPHACHLCHRAYKKGYMLRRHMASHSDFKPFVCDVCDKGFYQAYYLTRHKRTHLSQKPFVCEVCDKGFGQRFTLKKHQLLHAERKPFTCDLCDKGYTQLRDLTKHRLMHNGHKPYECDVCGKRYFGPDNLKRHKQTHTGHSPFTCEVCNDSFVSPGDFRTHKMIHLDLKPLVCDLCTQVSAQADGLKRNRRDLAKEKLYKCPHYDNNEDVGQHGRGHKSSSSSSSRARPGSGTGKMLVWAHPI